MMEVKRNLSLKTRSISLSLLLNCEYIIQENFICIKKRNKKIMKKVHKLRCPRYTGETLKCYQIFFYGDSEDYYSR